MSAQTPMTAGEIRAALGMLAAGMSRRVVANVFRRHPKTIAKVARAGHVLAEMRERQRVYVITDPGRLLPSRIFAAPDRITDVERIETPASDSAWSGAGLLDAAAPGLAAGADPGAAGAIESGRTRRPVEIGDSGRNRRGAVRDGG